MGHIFHKYNLFGDIMPQLVYLNILIFVLLLSKIKTEPSWGRLNSTFSRAYIHIVPHHGNIYQRNKNSSEVKLNNQINFHYFSVI